MSSLLYLWVQSANDHHTALCSNHGNIKQEVPNVCIWHYDISCFSFLSFLSLALALLAISAECSPVLLCPSHFTCFRLFNHWHSTASRTNTNTSLHLAQAFKYVGDCMCVGIEMCCSCGNMCLHHLAYSRYFAGVYFKRTNLSWCNCRLSLHVPCFGIVPNNNCGLFAVCFVWVYARECMYLQMLFPVCLLL